MDTKRKLEVMREVDEANRKHVEDWKKQQSRKAEQDIVESMGRKENESDKPAERGR